MSEKKLPEIPEPITILLESGLYTHFELNPKKIRAVEQFRGTLDLYCPACSQQSVFEPAQILDDQAGQRRALLAPVIGAGPTPTADELDRRTLHCRFFAVGFKCTRDSHHLAAFFFHVGPNSFCKVGQSPSRADVQHPELRKYREILGPSFRELTKAVGLAAHGIGVGSFVYLRRILEKFIEEAALRKQQQSPEWSIEQWGKRRIPEKIKDLDGFLPEFLVENTLLYGILSKGIHELDEEDCLNHFDVVRLGIELILDEKLAIEEKQRKRKLVRDRLTQIKANTG